MDPPPIVLSEDNFGDIYTIDEEDISNENVSEVLEKVDIIEDIKLEEEKIKTVEEENFNILSVKDEFDYKKYLEEASNGWPKSFLDIKMKIASELFKMQELSKFQIAIYSDMFFNCLFYGFPTPQEHRNTVSDIIRKSPFLIELLTKN